MNAQNNNSINQSGADEFEKFVYLLSHDLRNSIRALIEVPQWIEEDMIAAGVKIDGSLSENIGLMNTHTRRLDRMLIDLLTYSRVGRKQVSETISLKDAIELVLDQIIVPKSFKLELSLKCKKILMGERDILTLFTELITNSIKHNEIGAGRIGISSHQIDGVCIISISDDGPGIPEKYRKRVFEAMTTLKPRDEVEGSGMGLATVQKIVKFYSGEIFFPEVTNRNGTTLEIRLPI